MLVTKKQGLLEPEVVILKKHDPIPILKSGVCFFVYRRRHSCQRIEHSTKEVDEDGEKITV